MSEDNVFLTVEGIQDVVHVAPTLIRAEISDLGVRGNVAPQVRVRDAAPISALIQPRPIIGDVTTTVRGKRWP